MSGNNSRQSAELLMEELTKFCQSDSLSEGGLREIIERHGCEPNNNPNNKNYEFFLKACCNERVNEGIIRCLLEYFPDAASATNNFGWTPLHCACWNKNITLKIVHEGIIRCLLEYFPDVASATNYDGCTPLHDACSNKNTTLSIVQILIDAAPTTVRHVNNIGWMPLHKLCFSENVDEKITMDILKLLIEKCPEAVRHADNKGFLPIHAACGPQSPEFCRVLIEAYPGSERIADAIGTLPLHYACSNGTVAVVEYLYKLYPDAINHETEDGRCAIHAAIFRDHLAAAVDVVECLLDCDPNVKLQKFQGRLSLLLFACVRKYNDSNIEAGIQVIKLIYDAHPEAIDDNEIMSNIHRCHPRVQTFIHSELVYSRQARNPRLMMTPDEKGQLPLHIALRNNVRLGSIKLLVKGNPSAIRNIGTIPLHVACQHHESASVVQYLIELDTTTLETVDRDGNTALHLGCRGAKYDTIALLLEKYDAVSVSKRNAHKKLPIDLLFESNEVLDTESVESMESIFRLLRAYPETLMNNSMHAEQRSFPAAYKSSSGKKRKFDV